jgi:GR25 family glycosyltransferase involved in LPS biosynthesis
MELIQKYHFYINLEKRVEKKSQCEEELKKIGINSPNRFDAISHEIGIVGCVKSHIRCIELAKERDYPFVCIFEDDIVFRNIEKCHEMINKYIDYDYDVLYLGCRVLNNNYEFITEELIRIDSAWCNHAYLIKSHYYDILLKNYYDGMNLKIKEGKEKHAKRLSEQYNIDVYLNSLQKKDKWYCLNPIMVTQRNGYSDNFNIDINFHDEIFIIPIHNSILPKVSILTTTFNRRKFLQLMISNIKYFDYPKEKIEWLILDSLGINGEKGGKLLNNYEKTKIEIYLGIEINYHYIDKKMSIGEKRNWLSNRAKYDILINMDDDDIYLSEYIQHSIDNLITFNKDIIGCLDMIFIYPEYNYKTTIISCVKEYQLYHEATLCMRKKHWEKYKYRDNSEGEGCDIYGNKEVCCESNIIKTMVCVCWENNTINKEEFSKNEIKLEMRGEQMNILKNIFANETKMEDLKQDNETCETKVEISIKLLQDIRNIIEVANSRVKWKIEELLPVGLAIKNIDELLGK